MATVIRSLAVGGLTQAELLARLREQGVALNDAALASAGAVD